MRVVSLDDADGVLRKYGHALSHPNVPRHDPDGE